MRVAVASTFVPFIRGGATKIVSDLVGALRERGHEVDTIEIPFDSSPAEQLEQMLALRLLDVGDRADRLIAIRTPSYLLRHPSKVVWFIHHHRGAYDLWGTPYQDVPDTIEGRAIRDGIHAADSLGLGEARAIYANSGITAKRLRRFNDIEAPVLYPPLTGVERFRCEPAEDFIFYPSRITYHKRQWLVVEAMAHVRSGVRLVIAGVPDDPDQRAHIEHKIAEAGVADRVEVVGRWVTEEEKLDWLARCLGVAYLPFDEDSYGYPTLEAFQSCKPVLTCTDSGGTLEIVEDGATGVVAEPDAASVGAAIDRLAGDRRAAAAMGLAGRERMAELGISWDDVVDALLG
jgi:glycosyltransferase involved in cell wall biosynthesis